MPPPGSPAKKNPAQRVVHNHAVGPRTIVIGTKRCQGNPRRGRHIAKHDGARAVTLILALVGAATPSVQAQAAPGAALGMELQGYPTGAILAARVGLRPGTWDWVRLWAGYNLTDRGDVGEHADEDGGGPGVGVGWRHAFRPGGEGAGWFLGVRTDLWVLSIDWRDPGRSGTTSVTVLQPTARAGYAWRVGGGWLLDLNLGLGAEINLATDGEPVGDGAILLVGVGIGR